MEVLLIIAIVVGFYMAYNIGANDVANSMADAVGSKALTVFWAVVLAAIFEFAGAVLVGSHVTNTIRKGIIDTTSFTDNPMILAQGMVCALLAAAVWLNCASIFGMPVSTTHSIIGAILGFGLLKAGMDHISWLTLGKVIASWFISPVAGGIIAFIIFKVISRYILAVDKPVLAAKKGVPICVFFTFVILILATIFKGLKPLKLDLNFPTALIISIIVGVVAAMVAGILMRRAHTKDDKPLRVQLLQVEKLFGFLVIITSCTVAFAHGSNDVANAVGPLAATIEIIKENVIREKSIVPLWVLVLGGGGIALGLATFGYRVMKKVGTEVTLITPSRGVAADLGAMVTVLACSRIGLPISTTHTLIGAILGVGMARGITAINRKTVRSIFASWIITVPIAAGLTMLFYWIGDALFWHGG